MERGRLADQGQQIATEVQIADQVGCPERVLVRFSRAPAVRILGELMHIDYVRDRAQGMKRAQSPPPFPAPLDADEEENSNSEEDEVLDRRVESLNEFREGRECHPHTHPEHRPKESDQNDENPEGTPRRAPWRFAR